MRTLAARPAVIPQMQDGLAIFEQLRLAAGISFPETQELCVRAAVPYLQYLEARLGQRELSASQLESLTKALTTFTGGRA
jgi:hypothetical protein